MNLLCCHVARFNLKSFGRSSRIFESFAGISFFERALRSFASSSVLNRIVLLCPSEDASFFEKQAEALTLPRPVQIVPVEKNSSYSFEPTQSLFQPLSFSTRDLFGLWSLEGLETLVPALGADRLIFFNLESFWFLNEAHVDFLFQALDSSEFSWSLGNPEERVGGLDWKRARSWIPQMRFLERQDLESKSDLWKNLTAQTLPDSANAIHQERSSRMKKTFTHLRQTSALLKKASGKLSWEPDFRARVSREAWALSLRTDFGWEILKKRDAFADTAEPSKWRSFLEGQNSFLPVVMQVECRSAEGRKLEEKDFIRTVDVWKAIPYWILRDPSGADAEPWTARLHASGAAAVYAESPLEELSPERLEAFYRANGSAWVVRVDDAFPVSEQTLSVLLAVRDRFPNSFLLFKIRNAPEDGGFMSRFVQRWQYLADGVVVSGEQGHRFAHFAKPDESCSKSPFEVWLRANGALSLCSEISVGDLDSARPKDWEKASFQAGKMPFCRGCSRRHDYGSAWIPRLPEFLSHEFRLPDWVQALLLSKSDAWISQNVPEKALLLLEALLKTNPAGAEAWERIQKIEMSVLPRG